MQRRLFFALGLALIAAFTLEPILREWLIGQQLSVTSGTVVAVFLAILVVVSASAFALESWLIRPITADIMRAAEEKRADSGAEFFASIFYASPVGLMMARMDTLQVAAVNDAFLNILGVERQDVLGRSEKDLVLLPEEQPDTPLTPVLTRLRTAAGEHREALIAVHILRIGKTRYRITAVTEASALQKAFNSLGESETRYRQLFDNNLAVKLIVDPDDGRIVNANRAAERFYGYPVATLCRMHIGEIDSASGFAHLLPETADAGGMLFETRHHLASGEQRGVEVYTGPLVLDGRKLLFLIVHDISPRHQAQRALRREQALAQATLNAIADAIIRCNGEGAVEFMNRNAEELISRNLEEARGQPLATVLQLRDEDSDHPIELLRAEGDETPYKLIARIRTTKRELITQITTAGFEQEDGFVVVLHDITSLRQLSRKLSYQAAHDSLTGLINRREFERQLAAHIAQAHEESDSHVLCYIDLDQFKVVNDTSGHRAGDALLAHIGELLGHGTGRSDIVARLGGDEFGLLLTHCDIARAEGIAANLIENIGQMPFAWENKQFHIGASIGIVLIDDGTHSLEEAMSTADSACYLAKERGRNRYVIHLNQEDTVIQRQREMEWLLHLHGAINENGFLLHFQRVQALNPNPAQPQQFELLLRMRSPEGGEEIRPDSFIPAAERFGMMPGIDRWVIKQACSLLQEVDPKAPVLLYVNLSGNSLAHPAMVEFTTRAIRESGINGRQLGFEITETAAIGNINQAHRFIDALSALGCHFALDDFGSGLSSFAYLKNLRVQKIKIDGSFVRDMLQDPVNFAMVEAINRIGHTLGMQTVAEWVESLEMIDEVRTMGIDYIQGYAVDGGSQPLETLRELLVKVPAHA